MKKRLGEISTKNKTSNYLWKPSAGKQNIRIVPFKGDPENPFIELKFHYDFGGKNYLSPATFNRPDPIVEFANKLRQTGDQDDYKLGTGLFPKMRIYAPVIVRGEEEKGVRFWGFGKQVYQQLLGLVADEDYGDISDLKEGNDITVEYTPKEETTKSFPETHIRPRPKKTPVADEENRKAVMEAIKNQISLTDIFPEPSYEELKSALEAYLNPEADDEEASESETEDTKSGDVAKDSDTEPDEPSQSEKKAPKKSVASAEDDFDKLFNS